MQKDDVIYRQDAIDVLDIGKELLSCALDNMDIVGNDRKRFEWALGLIESYIEDIKDIPFAQPEELTDDDFETIRIHLNAYKEKLCNQRRWKEAEEYQRIIDRFMTFASAQSELGKGKWIRNDNGTYSCSICQSWIPEEQYHYARYCLYCGAEMRENDNEK